MDAVTRAMVMIPAATVLIGAPEGHLSALAGAQHYGRAWFEDESPQHYATLGAFLLDRHPVTNAAFDRFVRATGYRTHAEQRGFGSVYASGYWEARPGSDWKHPGGPEDSITERLDHPVVHVDHADATAFAQWAGKRLPTEAEWEYAAHGPTWQTLPWGNNWDENRVVGARTGPVADPKTWRAWWDEHYERNATVPGTAAVAGRSPAGDSPFGISDMIGNVSEWTADHYRPYDETRSYEPMYQAAAGRYRVVRGGGWMHMRHQLRTTERFAAAPDYSNHALGFRCAADPGTTTDY
ncbi:formylglycine-generating enzyme family protein [Streptomyces sp. NPDC055992]|uniref:formylglycine-generating enzyme family protein n=1 Tax=Streptomyces sp. NPDC055992 TaxID=3345673 RepID=UPI0035D71F9A